MNLESSLIGKSSLIKKLRKEIPRLAKFNHILLIGEKGAGKSLIARLIHEASKSKRSILNSLTPSEENIKETFEKSNTDTTIFIQEIEGFSFLNQGIIAHVIDSLSKKLSPKIIITAKKNIQQLKKEGTLLDSLYDTLNTFDEAEIPPLSERTEDIPLLVEHFMNNACERIGTELKVIDINALDFLVRREWKENILELKSVIEKSVLTSENETIELPKYLVDEYVQLSGIMSNIEKKKAFSFDKSLSNLEKTLIEKTLEAVSHNQTKAAEILNITDANLRYRLRKFKILTSKK